MKINIKSVVKRPQLVFCGTWWKYYRSSFSIVCVKSHDSSWSNQLKLLQYFELNSVGLWQECTFQTFDQWCHHIFPVPSNSRLKNVENKLIIDICGQVCINGFQIGINKDHYAGNICARFEIDDFIRLQNDREKTFLLCWKINRERYHLESLNFPSDGKVNVGLKLCLTISKLGHALWPLSNVTLTVCSESAWHCRYCRRRGIPCICYVNTIESGKYCERLWCETACRSPVCSLHYRHDLPR